MERIRCNCRQCGSKLSDFMNLWIQVGKSYCTPVAQPAGSIQIKHHGGARLGDTQTLVEGCKLQDVACSTCGTVVGLKCLSTPLNHVFDDDQILFRLSSVETVSCRGAKKVEFTINRTLQLRQPPAGPQEGRPRPTSSATYPQGQGEIPTSREEVDFARIQANLDLNRKDIDRLDTAGFQVVSALDEAVQRVEAETKRLQKSVQDLRNDFGGTRDDIDFLKTELEGIKETAGNNVISRLDSQMQYISEAAVPSLREELESFRTQSRKEAQRLESQLSQATLGSGHLKGIVESNALTVKEHTMELTSLWTEVSTLKELLLQEPVPQPLERSTGVSNRELDILSDNIARLGHRASQVETLQMQFEILKGRVERMDSQRLNASMTPTHSSNHRKRPHQDVPQAEASFGPDTSPKADTLDSPSVKRPNLTKSGAVDGRMQTRSSRLS